MASDSNNNDNNQVYINTQEVSFLLKSSYNRLDQIMSFSTIHDTLAEEENIQKMNPSGEERKRSALCLKMEAAEAAFRKKFKRKEIPPFEKHLHIGLGFCWYISGLVERDLHKREYCFEMSLQTNSKIGYNYGYLRSALLLACCKEKRLVQERIHPSPPPPPPPKAKRYYDDSTDTSDYTDEEETKGKNDEGDDDLILSVESNLLYDLLNFYSESQRRTEIFCQTEDDQEGIIMIQMVASNFFLSLEDPNIQENALFYFNRLKIQVIPDRTALLYEWRRYGSVLMSLGRANVLAKKYEDAHSYYEKSLNLFFFIFHQRMYDSEKNCDAQLKVPDDDGGDDDDDQTQQEASNNRDRHNENVTMDGNRKTVRIMWPQKSQRDCLLQISFALCSIIDIKNSTNNDLVLDKAHEEDATFENVNRDLFSKIYAQTRKSNKRYVKMKPQQLYQHAFGICAHICNLKVNPTQITSEEDLRIYYAMYCILIQLGYENAAVEIQAYLEKFDRPFDNEKNKPQKNLERIYMVSEYISRRFRIFWFTI